MRSMALFLALLLASSPALLVGAQGKPLVVVFAKGMMKPDASLNWMMGNITQVEWKVYTETIKFDDIKNAALLILVQVDTSQNYTKDEISAIKQWFDQGGKVLWVTGDSDYKGGDYLRIAPANSVLEAVGSVLRNDHCEATDPKLAPAKPYHVAAIISPDPPLSVLADGISNYVLFHGPGAVAAYYNGKWMNLVNETIPNVYRIAWTSDGGAIAEFTPPLPQAYPVNYRGKILEMAAEVMPNNGIVIFSAEAPFDHYKGMWISSYEEFPKLDGPKFVTNVVLWAVGLKGTKPTYQGGGANIALWTSIIVVIIIVIALAVLLMRRKKS
ncbi:MAG: hypothetical protein DSO07_00515 [Thermoproteota archaeon]|jgi:hypothetical protein|nr:hypothetical protein [Candidatus Methanodesulfokores washburnensis]TDA42213.1 MAG: hypothetical protein DSO07_00515 [Candidatus Korarchaeota archaeon]